MKSPGGTTNVALILQQSYSSSLQHQEPRENHFGHSSNETVALHGRHCEKSWLRGNQSWRRGGPYARAAAPARHVLLAKAVQTLKACSSKWINENGSNFSWQEGYGAFSVSASQTNAVIRYIEDQRTHHEKRSFEEEFLQLLKNYGVKYDPKHVLG